MPTRVSRGGSWRMLAAICRLCMRSVSRCLRETHGAVCREIPGLLHLSQPSTPQLCHRHPLLLLMEEKNDKNTWRCPNQSADSEAVYWRRAHACHCRPCKAEHHLLQACCDENKGRRGRRALGEGGGMVLRTAEEERKKSCVFFTGI